MADNKRLLEVRKTIKAKKPTFVQQDYHKKRRLSLKWKRPTGLQSKMRHQFKGYARRVKQGWRSPVEIRGYHMLGYEPVIVHTVAQLETVKPGQGVVIASTVGTKKRLAIVEKATQLKIIILNIKADSFKQNLEAKKARLAEEKKQREEKKKKSLEDSAKKSKKKEEEKKKLEEAAAPQSEEEKKEEEKKEKDEVLIHKQ